MNSPQRRPASEPAATLWTTLSRAARSGAALHLPLAGQPVFPVEALLERAERTAGQLLAALRAGRPPARVGLLMVNGEPWIRGLLAAFRLGAAAVPLALPVAFPGVETYLEHLRRIGADARLDAILVDASVHRLVPRLAAGLPGVPLVDTTTVPAGPAPRELPAAADAGPLAVVQYTSGSTSAPKGVALTHANVIAGLASLADGVAWTADDAMGIWIPLFHDMGLFLTLSALARGSSVCLWKPSDFVRDARGWLASFAASPATAAPAPNFAYDALVAAVRTGGVPEGLDLSRWRIAYNGAEPVHLRTIEAFQATFGPYGFRPEAMLPCYGLAEATLVATFPVPGSRPRSLHVDRFALDPGDAVRRTARDAPEARSVVSVGRAAPGLEVRIGGGGRPVPEGVVGEVEIRGPAVTGGYLGRPREEQPFGAEGWLRTGDLAFQHDGDLFIVGRLKDMIVVRGQNFYAEDVEELVRGTPGLGRCRCVALATELDGRECMLVLVETSLGPDEAEALAGRVRAAVTTRFGLEAIRVAPVPPRGIPFTSSGKVQRKAARARYERRELGREPRGRHAGGAER